MVINVYVAMIGWFGFDSKPLTMFWSVPPCCFSENMPSLDFVGRASDHFVCFYSISEARLAVSGKKHLRLTVNG